MLVGLSLLRNEDWICAYSLRVALQWCDRLVVLCHSCEDQTAEIVEDLRRETGRITILTDPDPLFEEMDLRQRMLATARDCGATHIAICDGDEILSANVTAQMRRRIFLLPPGGVLVTPIHNLWRSLDQRRSDVTSNFGGAWCVLAFRDSPAVTWKPAEDGYQFHQRLPLGNWLSPMRYPPERPIGGLMHCQHASWRRLLAKQSLYKLQEVLRWPHRNRGEIDKLYSGTVDEAGLLTTAVPPEWWAHGFDRSLITPDAEPWQEAEVHRLIAEHGREAFADLDLFGVPDTIA